jgi:UDP-N-acetylglucosamine 1-carboxyvinyltransferase
MGVSINGISSHELMIRGKKKLRGAHYTVTPDYLEAGTLVIAALLTRGEVVVRNIIPHDLDALWNLLREMKVHFTLGKNYARLKPTRTFLNCRRLQTNVFPGFPTDLQPPFVVLLTQAKGKSRIHETLFEGRFAYFPDLLKLGARIEKLNPHEAIVTGPTQLRGTTVKSWDIRAGAAMILAALVSKGKTVIRDIHYIDRGYEQFDGKLCSLGADITRLP